TAMAGRQAALFATDPPYLVGYTGADRPRTSRILTYAIFVVFIQLRIDIGVKRCQNGTRSMFPNVINPQPIWQQMVVTRVRRMGAPTTPARTGAAPTARSTSATRRHSCWRPLPTPPRFAVPTPPGTAGTRTSAPP